MSIGSRIAAAPDDARFGVASLCAIAFICMAPANDELIGIASFERYLWFAVDVVVLVFLLQRRERFFACLLDNPALTAWPAVAIASAAWSLTPGISLYHGLQLLMTILAGYVLRSAFGLLHLVKVIFFGLLLAQILSVAAVFAAPRIAIGTGQEWLGIYPHKNVLGSMMALGMICAACLFMHGWRRPLAALGFLGAFVILYKTKSATALGAAALGLIPLVMVAAWVRGQVVTGVALGLSIILGSVMIGVVALYGSELASAVLLDLGKDRTLTGRTMLWQFGIDQFWREPWIGIGYKAYWESPETPAAYLHYNIRQKLWFFHNNVLDVAVAFGILGLSVFAAGFAESARRALAALAAKPGYIEALPLMFCCYVGMLAGFENVLFQNHSLNQMLFAAVLPLSAALLSRSGGESRRTSADGLYSGQGRAPARRSGYSQAMPPTRAAWPGLS